MKHFLYNVGRDQMCTYKVLSILRIVITLKLFGGTTNCVEDFLLSS